MSWRVFDVIDVFLTSWLTFWIMFALIDVMDKRFDVMEFFDDMKHFWRPDARHYDERFVVMTYFCQYFGNKI